MKIAVTGATGQLGRLVIEKLKTRVAADQIIALVRNPDQAGDLGVTLREFDYNRPDTLEPALQGVERLLLISSSEMDRRVPQHLAVIAAAKAAGVAHVVYTSLLHADRSPIGFAKDHLATEQALAGSGLAFTVLRNGWYTENYTPSIPVALANGAFVSAAEDGRVSSAPRADYAEAAALVMTSDGHAGQTYELAGDDAWTMADLAAEVSARSGQVVGYHRVSKQENAAILLAAGLPPLMAEAIADSDAAVALGALYDDSHTLSRLIARPTVPMAETVAAALAAS